MSGVAVRGVLAVVLAATGVAGAEETIWDRYPAEDQVQLENHWEITLSTDGQATLAHRVVLQAMTDAGREALQSLEYETNRATEEFVVERACTVHLDGSERCTELDDVVFEPEEGADVIEGLVEPFHVVVPLTDVRVGSRVELEYRREVRLGADYRLYRRFRPTAAAGPSEGMTVVVRSSPARALHGRVRGEADHQRTEQDGEVVQTWVFGPRPRPPRDRDRPSKLELSPVLYLSEFEDWASFVEYYQPLADAARERFRGAPLRELEALGEPRINQLDPVIRYGLLLEDRAPVYSVGFSSVTLVPGEMKTVVKQAATEVDKAVALWTALTGAGVEAHLALATRNRLDQPFDFPCVKMFQDMGVWVEGRGFIHADGPPDWVDTVPSARRGGGVVILDPDGPRVMEGDDLDAMEDRPGWHKEGRLTISGGELRVHEQMRFSGSAETAARSTWRAIQDDLEDDEKTDRYIKRRYAQHFVKYPDDKLTQVEKATLGFIRERDWASGHLREARLFDAWDPDAEVEVRTRYTPDDALEQVGGLLLVRLPLVIEEVSQRCVRARPDRDAPVKVSCWTFTHHYELVIPDGYELAGLPGDQQIETEWATLTLQYREQGLVADRDDDEDGSGPGEKGLQPPLLSRDAPEEQRTVPGVVVTADYQIHHNRVPAADYEAFLQVAARHALSFADPVVLQLVGTH